MENVNKERLFWIYCDDIAISNMGGICLCHLIGDIMDDVIMIYMMK
jgi:hypothetical protein